MVGIRQSVWPASSHSLGLLSASANVSLRSIRAGFCHISPVFRSLIVPSPLSR